MSVKSNVCLERERALFQKRAGTVRVIPRAIALHNKASRSTEVIPETVNATTIPSTTNRRAK